MSQRFAGLGLAALVILSGVFPALAMTKWVPLPISKSEALADRPLPGDAARGRLVFAKCRACHEVGSRADHRIGPDLSGILGRPAAAHPDYGYSAALRKAGGEGLIWSPEFLDDYLKSPARFLPGNGMAFIGLESKEERRDLIAYLATYKAPKDAAWLISNNITQAAIPLPVQSPISR